MPIRASPLSFRDSMRISHTTSMARGKNFTIANLSCRVDQTICAQSSTNSLSPRDVMWCWRKSCHQEERISVTAAHAFGLSKSFGSLQFINAGLKQQIICCRLVFDFGGEYLRDYSISFICLKYWSNWILLVEIFFRPVISDSSDDLGNWDVGGYIEFQVF